MGGHVGDVDAVFAVGGEIHFRENAAACPQRQSGNVRELIAGSRAERPALRASIALAERRDSDVMGGKDVLLNEGRRNLQGGRDVVEALRGVVRRQQFGAVDVDQKQIVDRVFVLLAIQPMQHLAVGDVRLRWEACRANLRATRPANRPPCRPAAWRPEAA